MPTRHRSACLVAIGVALGSTVDALAQDDDASAPARRPPTLPIRAEAPPGDAEQGRLHATAPASATSVERQGPSPTEPTDEGDDLDLEMASLGLEEAALMAELNAELGAEASTASGSGLELYGFADFSFYKFFIEDSSLLRAYVYAQSSFAVGNLNLYLSSDLSADWRALSEVRFTFLPNGARQAEGQQVERVDTTVGDYVNFGGQPRVGGIMIERAWLEYRFDSLLVVRMGKWLTPYGIWNVDHGTPTIIPVVRPYVIALELIPERQTGIQLHGRHWVTDQINLGYSLSLSNGRGPVDDYADLDENKAVTARLRATHRGFGVLELGATSYYGRFTDQSQSVVARGTGFAVQERIVSQYDELAWGFDVRWKLGGLHAQAELLTADGRYTNAGREQRTATEFQPDRRSRGAYALVGYRFDWLGLMPFVTWEHFELTNVVEVFRPGTTDVITGGALGVNARPTPTVTLKAAAYAGFFPGGEVGSAYESALWSAQSQIAWAF